MPAVSVIVPVYNPGKYIYRCLDSICGQTLHDIEIICVNDLSTDGSIEVLREYESKDDRIVVVDSEVNRGAATSRNEAIRIAHGEFLAFVDSDDSIDGDFLERLYSRACETGADIVKGERRFYDPATGCMSPDIPFMAEMHQKVKRQKAWFVNAFTTAIYKTDLVRRHDVRFLDGVVFFEDAYFTIMATIFNEKTEVVDGTFYNYTRNPDSVCAKGVNAAQVQGRMQGTSALMDLFDKYPVSEEHYLTVCDYLFLEMLVICRNITLPDALTKAGAEGIMLVLNRCSCPEMLIYRHFMEFKKLNRKNMVQMLRKRHQNM